MTTAYSGEQLTMKRVVSLIFMPAVLFLSVFVLSAVLLEHHGPVYLSLLISILVVLVPFEVGVLVAANRRQYGTTGLRVAFKRHEPMPVWRIVLEGLVLFGWAGLVFAVLQPFENSILLGSVFRFVPGFLRSTTFAAQLAGFPKAVIVLTCTANLIVNGLIGPIVEELYFRGYLMSRMEYLGKWAPLVVVVLFSAYHLFTPWENVTRIVVFLPLHYAVWKDKNLYIGMVAHCACNLAVGISLFSLLMK
ncbi:MAG: CPBP family glutamic-type intramembrane protease [Candidatus Cryosericum sp.]